MAVEETAAGFWSWSCSSAEEDVETETAEVAAVEETTPADAEDHKA